MVHVLIYIYTNVLFMMYFRPLGDILYFMTTPLTTTADRDRLIRNIKWCISKTYYHHRYS